MPVRKLVESIEQDYDAVLTCIIAEPQCKPKAQTVEVPLRLLPFLLLLRRPLDAASVKFAQQPFDKRMGTRRSLSGPDEMRDDEIR